MACRYLLSNVSITASLHLSSLVSPSRPTICLKAFSCTFSNTALSPACWDAHLVLGTIEKFAVWNVGAGTLLDLYVNKNLGQSFLVYLEILK